MSRRIDPPGVGAILRRNSDDIRSLTRGPGRWIYVGTYPGDAGTVPESPPFQNGHSNSGGGFPPLRFRISKWRDVEIEGAVDGDIGTVIFTLPLEYRPDYSLRFTCPSATSVPATIQIDPNGDVTQIA